MFGISASQFFVNTQLVPWFWILAALILLYLIKPKPQQQTIPSLMFLLQDKGKAFRNSFLRYLYRDFVFFLQLLILALLIAAACRPFIQVNKASFIGNSVIVLDVSASMQAKDGRWDAAKTAAIDNLAGQNTIILIANRPIVYAKEVSRGEAQNMLKSLQPLDTTTNLYASIAAAKEYAPDSNSKVTIISDFLNTDEQQSWQAAVKILQAGSALVRTIQVGGPAKNVGITSVDVQEDKTRIGVTNYLGAATAVTLSAANFSQAMPLADGATDYVTINTPPGVTEVHIDSKDDLDVDNVAYIANNQNLNVHALIITNNPAIKTTNLWYALQAINDKTPLKLSIDINNPPQLVSPQGYDIVFFVDVDPNLIVQRTIRDVQDYVQNGGAAVINYQSNLFAINYENLLPYTYNDTGGASAVLSASPSPITKDVDFGDTQTYLKVQGKGLVLAQAQDNSPLISLIPLGQGSVLYYGIPDAKASFPYQPSYSVFWKRSLDQLTGKASLDRLNYQAGQPPLLAGTPTKSPVQDYQGFLDKQGVYTFAGYSVAANLESSQESKISAEPIEDVTGQTQGVNADQTKMEEFDTLCILAALLLLVLELFIVKFRGDF